MKRQYCTLCGYTLKLRLSIFFHKTVFFFNSNPVKLFEAWLIPNPPIWDESLEKIVKSRNTTIQVKALNLPIAAPYIGLIIETVVWPAEQRINYGSLMLYYNIINIRLAKQIIQEKRAQNDQNTFEKVRAIAEELNIKLETAVTEKKSEWTGRIKDEVGNKI